MKLNAVERLAMNNGIRAGHQRHREAAWFHSLSRGRLAGAEVLELGCGRGVGVEILLDRMGAAHVTAVDVDPQMLELARRRLHVPAAGGRVDIVEADAALLPTGDETCDAVVDFGAIHHVQDWRACLGEVARVLRPGGQLLFEEVPAHVLGSWVFRTFTEHPREDRFEPDAFARALSAHGLHGTGSFARRLGGMVFVGSALKLA